MIETVWRPVLALLLFLLFACPSLAQQSGAAGCPGGEVPSASLMGRVVQITTVTGARWTGSVVGVVADTLTVQLSGSATTYRIDLGLISCIRVVGGGGVPGTKLRVHGSNTIGAQLMPTILEAFVGSPQGTTRVVPGPVPEERVIHFGSGQRLPGLEVELFAHGSDTAFTGLLTRKADLGMSSRPVRDAERESISRAGMGDLRSVDQEHVVALDALPVITHRDNPITQLPLSALRAIFTGSITDWKDVGGRPGRIQVYSRDDKSGTFQTCVDFLHRGAPLTTAARTFESSEQLSDTVAGDPNGIGCVGFPYIRDTRALAVSQSCGLTSTSTPFGARTEEYPLARRLFLYSPNQPAPMVLDLVRFALSAATWPVVDASGFVSLAPELAPRSYSAERVLSATEVRGNASTHIDHSEAASLAAKLRELFRESQRLSITFRFQDGGHRLDNRAIADIARLADWSRDAANQNRGLTLVGYSSAIGLFGPNVALSGSRANEVGKELRAKGVRVDRILGVGPLSAVACNFNDAGENNLRGQELNRRVEVWVKR